MIDRSRLVPLIRVIMYDRYIHATYVVKRQHSAYRLTSGDNYELINRRIGASASAKPYRNNGAVDDDREATKG